MPSGTLCDVGAHLLLRPRLQFADRGFDGISAVAVEQRGEAALADGQRADLGLDVADPLLWHADVGQDDVDDVGHHFAAAYELHRRNAQAFLLDLRRLGGEAARHHAAGVGPVAGVGQIAPQPVAVIERLHHLHVHQMGAAEIGIVDDDNVARLKVVAALDHRLGGELHDADEDRQAQLALGDDLAGVAMVDAVGAVEGLGDDRRERGLLVHQVHLARDLAQAVLDDREGDRIEGHFRRISR